MILSYYNQTVELFPKEYFPEGPPKRVVVNVSGGLDSASLLFLLVYYFPQIEKHIFTGDDAHHPLDAARAKVVVQYMKDQYSPHNIKSHDVIPFNDRDPEIIKEVRQMVEDDPSYYDKYPWKKMPGQEEREEESFLMKIAKPLITDRNVYELMSKYNCKRVLSGMTQNPPIKDMEELRFTHLAESKRNEGRNEVAVFNPRGRHYHPYARVNKLFVKGVFENHGLMDVLYPVTGSCTGAQYSTAYWTKPCKKCFWCHEKKWAFGKF